MRYSIVVMSDTLDKFASLNQKVRTRTASGTEHAEWQSLAHTLVDAEVVARAHQNPGEGRHHVRTAIRKMAFVEGARGAAASASVSLGTGGFKVHAGLPEWMGDFLDITIPLEEHLEPVHAKTRVAWRRPGSAGLAIMEVSDTDRAHLESTVILSMLQA